MVENVNPFFISKYDNHGLVLFVHPLNCDNYYSWRRTMVMAYIGRNKFDFVDDTIIAPQENDVIFPLWRCNSNIVASWILNLVSKEIQAFVIYSITAIEIWNDLHMCFHQNNGHTVFQLKKDFLSCNQGSLPVSQHFTNSRFYGKNLGNINSFTHAIVAMFNLSSIFFNKNTL